MEGVSELWRDVPDDRRAFAKLQLVLGSDVKAYSRGAVISYSAGKRAMTSTIRDDKMSITGCYDPDIPPFFAVRIYDLAPSDPTAIISAPLCTVKTQKGKGNYYSRPKGLA